MDPDVLRQLRCPLCGGHLDLLAGGGPAAVLRCGRGHSFDIARQGYVNLTAGRPVHSGDTPPMVAARAEFLAAGHYDMISAALARLAIRYVRVALTDQPDRHPELVVDAGSGTGRHLAAVLDVLPATVGLALDVSKPALRRAARAHPRAAAALTDTWRPLPLANASAAVLLNVFAPRNGSEFHRVLRPDGVLLVVTPARVHLAELVGPLNLLRVDPDKADRVAGSLGDRFELVEEAIQDRPLRLSRTEVRTLVGMGPSAWHTDPVRLVERINRLDEPVAVTAAVRVQTYRPR